MLATDDRQWESPDYLWDHQHCGLSPPGLAKLSKRPGNPLGARGSAKTKLGVEGVEIRDEVKRAKLVTWKLESIPSVHLTATLNVQLYHEQSFLCTLLQIPCVPHPKTVDTAILSSPKGDSMGWCGTCLGLQLPKGWSCECRATT
jgi:hypothetical protein